MRPAACRLTRGRASCAEPGWPRSRSCGRSVFPARSAAAMPARIWRFSYPKSTSRRSSLSAFGMRSATKTCATRSSTLAKSSMVICAGCGGASGGFSVLLSSGCSGAPSGASAGVELRRLLANSAGTWCTCAVSTGCSEFTGAVVVGVIWSSPGCPAAPASPGAVAGPSTDPTDGDAVACEGAASLPCPGGSLHSARVVLVLKVLHTFDRVLFCAGEQGRWIVKPGAGRQSTPCEVGEKRLPGRVVDRAQAQADAKPSPPKPAGSG